MNMKQSIIAFFVLLFLSACSNYVDEYEEDYKKEFGDKEAFIENLNKVNSDVTAACNSGDWIWCAAKDGSYSTANEGLLEQFTEGSSKISFYGKDENAYDFSANTVGEDLMPYLRRNGGIAFSVSHVSDNDVAGLNINVSALGHYLKNNNIVLAYKNECSNASIRVLLTKNGGELGLYQANLNGEGVVELKPESYKKIIGDYAWNDAVQLADDNVRLSLFFSESCPENKYFLLIGVGLKFVEHSNTNVTSSSSSFVPKTISSSSTKSSSSMRSSSSVRSSSSSKAKSSSSSKAKSSSSVKSSSSALLGFLWNGADMSDVVKTGVGKASSWSSYSDVDVSVTTWIQEPVGGVYKTCAGKCGMVHYGSGGATSNPYTGIGFKLDAAGNAYDVSSWKGLCVVYDSDDSLQLKLVSGVTDKNTFRKVFPSVVLDKVTEADGGYKKVNFLWTDFKEVMPTGNFELTNSVRDLKEIVIEFEGSANTKQYFNIYEIGSYGKCVTPTKKDVPMSIFDFYETGILKEDLIWYGANKLKGDTSYLVKDKYLSDYVWVNANAAEYIDFGMDIDDLIPDQLISDCKGGVCGKVKTIPEDSTLNFGFGVDTKIDRSTIEDWGGLCVTYLASNEGLTLYIGTGLNSYSTDTLNWNLYHIDLPKAETVTTSCYSWSQFTQFNASPVVKLDSYLPRVNDVSFQIKGNFSKESFNVIAIGSYKAGKTAYDEFMQDKENRTSAWLYMNPTVTYGTLTDDRDGQIYRTVSIGDQLWMAENINYETKNSYCYNDSSKYCNVYGRLYTWESAKNVCPTGWRLPSQQDYDKLQSIENAGLKLKAAKGWYHNGNGEDSYGFAALPAGMYGASLERYTYFWSSTEYNGAAASAVLMFYDDNNVVISSNEDKLNAFSVRCISNLDLLIDERGDEVRAYKTVKIGNQIWMAENLNYVSASDGVNGFCADDQCTGGRYYTWKEAIDQTPERCAFVDNCAGVIDESNFKGICPIGWRLPSEADFEELIAQLETYDAAPLRSVEGWSVDVGDGTNTQGFNAYPMGVYAEDEAVKYMKVGEDAYFWSTKETSSEVEGIERKYARCLDISVTATINGLATDAAINIRCIKK